MRYNRVLGKARNFPFIEVVRNTLEVFSSPGCIDDTFFDVIYIDGDHTYNGCLSDLNRSLPLLSDRGLLIIDDYLPLYAEDTDQLEYGIIHAVSDFLSRNHSFFILSSNFKQIVLAKHSSYRVNNY